MRSAFRRCAPHGRGRALLQPRYSWRRNRDVRVALLCTASNGEGHGNIVLRHIAEHSSRPISKCTLDELLNLQNLPAAQRLSHLEEVLHVGISKIVVLLQNLPLGFGSVGPIRGVIQDYVNDIVDLRRCQCTDEERFQDCIQTIFARHRGMMGKISRGLREFQHEITTSFEPIAGLEPTICADVSEFVPAVRGIEKALDEFFTIRTTLRLLIAHCIQLHQTSNLKVMHELLVRVPDSIRDDEGVPQTRHVGAICLDTRPSMILLEAYRHASFMCQRDFARAPELLVNGVPAEKYFRENISQTASGLETRFPYVAVHLYFVFFEVLKNALVTSIMKSGLDKPPAIHASLIAGTSLMYENERTVKITDDGEGIRREDVRKVWSYFYTTRSGMNLEAMNLEAEESSDADLSFGTNLHARGLGLPVSRVLVRYFGGEIDINSIPKRGTDVYIYL